MFNKYFFYLALSALFFFSRLADAVEPTGLTCQAYSNYMLVTNVYGFSSVPAAVAGLAAANNSAGSSCGYTYSTDTYVFTDNASGGIASFHTYQIMIFSGQAPPCPQNNVSNQYNYAGANCTGTPTCPTGTTYDTTTGTCTNPPCPSGTNVSSGWYDTPNSGTGAPPTTACSGSCSVNYSGGSITKTAIVNGIPHYYSQGSYDTNGFTCSSGEPSVGFATAAVPPDTCPDGQIFVRNSFGFICALDFSAAAAASSVPATSSHPAGSSAPTQASVNTTSTTTNTSTGSTTTTTGTMTIPPITLNLPPDLAKTGDITSQTATLVSKMDELKFPYTDVTSKLGSAPTSELVPHTTPTFTATPVIFASAAGCPAPISFTVYGHDYFISYQPFCDFSSNIRTLFLALAAVTAAMIFAAGMTI
jgi:hypothetical protein